MVSRSASDARSARATIHANVSPGVQYTASRICSTSWDGRLTVSRTMRGPSLFSLTRLGRVTAPPRRSWLSVGPAVVVVVGMDSSSHTDREDGGLLLTIATGVCLQKKAAGRSAGPQPRWQRNGATEGRRMGTIRRRVQVLRRFSPIPRNGHHPGHGVSLCRTGSATGMPRPARHRPLLKNPKLLIYR